MKRISAVICELNPLHDGHRYVFFKAKEESDVLIAVMSGNFVQRGESAVYDKYKRASAALSAGADLVLELPFPFSASSAEFFAKAGVRIAEKAGADTLVFGSECGDIEALKRAGEVLDSSEYREAMKVGRSAHLRSEALKRLAPDLPESLLNSPNDILGAEYCRRAGIRTVAVQRISTESASLIRRRELSSGNTDMLDPARLLELEYIHFRTQREKRQGIAECSGGLWERLQNCARTSPDSYSWFESIKTKQYTNARLRRAALFSLVGLTAEEMAMEVLFTKVLGANAVGRDYLSALKKASDFPVITNASDKRNLDKDTSRQYELSEFADSIYALCMGCVDPGVFAKGRPVIVE